MFHMPSHTGEDRTNDAIHAAQDPNNPATAADAEQSIVEESKRAGVAAYRFDAQTSPEEKAAAAGAVRKMLCI